VSIDSFLQRPSTDGQELPIVLTTHASPETAILSALQAIAALPHLTQPPRMLRIAHI